MAAPDESAVICLPTYNERENLPRLLERLVALPPAFAVLVLDDSSPDGTGEIAAAWAGRHDRVRLLSGPARSGLGAAYRRGFAHLLGRRPRPRWIFQMDADFSHDPDELEPMRALAARAGADLVIGSRYARGGSTPGWPLSRRLLSRGANLFAGFMLGTGVRDVTSGFRCFSAPALERIAVHTTRTTGYGFLIESAWRTVAGGGRVREHPIAFTDRRVGQSKLGLGIAGESLSLVFRLAGRRLAGKEKDW